MQKIFSLFQKTWVRWFLFLLVLLAWFSGFQPWGRFSDPDAFYHSTMAAIMLKQGLIQDFYWLDLTSFAKPFVNQHFLFHVALIPFVALFGALQGGQIAAVIFAVLFCLIFAWALKAMRVRAPLFWTIFLAAMPAMTSRLSYGKASPFAVSFFVLGIAAVLAGSMWLSFFASALFVLSHGGWLLLPLAQGALLVGQALFLWSIESYSLKQIFLDTSWQKTVKLFCSSLLGLFAGLCLHPYREHLFAFLRVQLFQIGVATPYDRVVMGNEWYGLSPVMMMNWYYAFFVVLGFFLFGAIFVRRTLDREAMRFVLMLITPTIFLLTLNLKSARFVEYSAPLFVMVMAQLYRLIDVKEVFSALRRFLMPLRFAALLGVVALVLLLQWIDLFTASHQSSKSFEHYSGAMKVVDEYLQPGDRLFHSDWAMMPLLWAENQEIRYVAGLDPTFLLAQRPDLSDRYTQLTLGYATDTAYDVIVGDTQSKVVLIDRERGMALEKAVQADERFVLVYEDDHAAVYAIKTP